VRPGAERHPGVDHDVQCVGLCRIPRWTDTDGAHAHGPMEPPPAVLPAGLLGRGAERTERRQALESRTLFRVARLAPQPEADRAPAVDLLPARGLDRGQKVAHLGVVAGDVVREVERVAGKGLVAHAPNTARTLSRKLWSGS